LRERLFNVRPFDSLFFFEAFRPGVVDLDEAVANVHAITLPETAFEGELEITLLEAISFELVLYFVDLFFVIFISDFLSLLSFRSVCFVCFYRALPEERELLTLNQARKQEIRVTLAEAERPVMVPEGFFSLSFRRNEVFCESFMKQ
jgi:hypothetical protein